MKKVCKVCNEVKDFGNNSRSYTCQECLDAGYKYCSRCGNVKKLSDYRHVNGTPLYMCKDCERIYNASKSKELYARSEERRNAIKDACKRARSNQAGTAKANEYSRKYYDTDKGKEQNRIASSRWYATPKGKLYAKNKSHARRTQT